jgi:hypothetical protein
LQAEGTQTRRQRVRNTLSSRGDGSASLAKPDTPYGEKIEATLRLLYQAVCDFSSLGEQRRAKSLKGEI